MTNLTTPKVKDLVIPLSKYNQVQEIITKPNVSVNVDTENDTSELYDISELLPTTSTPILPVNQNQLKTELKEFFSKNKDTYKPL
jgi:hypothetical protein